MIILLTAPNLETAMWQTPSRDMTQPCITFTFHFHVSLLFNL
jgi:hypothetical protein